MHYVSLKLLYEKTFIAILITHTLLGNVSAQTNRADSFKADKEEMQAMMIAYKEKLNLSSEQERKMEAINKQYIADLNAIKRLQCNEVK